jgi:hypothetical protein
MNKQPTVRDLNEALRLRKKIDALQKETASLQQKLERTLGAAPVRKKAAVKKKATKKRPQRTRTSAKKTVAKKVAQKKAPVPKLRDVITQVITQAKRPLTLDEILTGIKKKGVKIKSKNPKNSLGVRMYTDKTFKKAKPGHFTMAR